MCRRRSICWLTRRGSWRIGRSYRRGATWRNRWSSCWRNGWRCRWRYCGRWCCRRWLCTRIFGTQQSTAGHSFIIICIKHTNIPLHTTTGFIGAFVYCRRDHRSRIAFDNLILTKCFIPLFLCRAPHKYIIVWSIFISYTSNCKRCGTARI